MTAPTCPACRSTLALTLSGDRGMCFHCSHQAGEFIYHEVRHRSPGQVARDEGAARVLDNAGQEWRDRIAFLIDDLARSRPDFTADEVRAAVQRAGLGEPHHANAYGAAMLAAARRGSIRKTGVLRKSSRPEANAHDNPVWGSLIYRAPQGVDLLAEQLEVW